MARFPRIYGLASLVVAMLAVASPAAAKSYSADRFDVTARLQPDRSLAVEERIVFRFEAGEFTYVFREIPVGGTDGIVDIAAEMDGAATPRGRGPGTIEVREGPRVRVTWHFAPVSGVHSVTLRYRLAGVVSAGDADDLLAWHVLPLQHDYRIAAMQATILLPPGARLATNPSLAPPDAEVRVGYAAGARQEQLAERLDIRARDLGQNDSMRLDVRLLPGALTRTPPTWQQVRADRARRGPWLLAAAAAVLVLAFGWLAAFWSAWRRSARDAPPPAHAAGSPPDPHLPVAFAARLAGSPAQPAPATMIDLATRGVVTIVETGSGHRLGGRKLMATLQQNPPGLRQHETAWLDVAFGTTMPRPREAPLDRVRRRFANARNAYRRALEDEMRREGLVDPERVAARSVLVRAALLALALALAGVAVAVAIAPAFGPWAALVPGSFGVVAAGYGIAAGMFSTLTREGERRRQAWKAYFADLRRIANDKRAGAAPLAAQGLPYAVAAGVGAAWARKLLSTPGRSAMPEWFHATAAAGDDPGAAFVAFLAAHAGTSGGSAGVAGGAPAAGGGSSGAG